MNFLSIQLHQSSSNILCIKFSISGTLSSQALICTDSAASVQTLGTIVQTQMTKVVCVRALQGHIQQTHPLPKHDQPGLDFTISHKHKPAQRKSSWRRASRCMKQELQMSTSRAERISLFGDQQYIFGDYLCHQLSFNFILLSYVASQKGIGCYTHLPL